MEPIGLSELGRRIAADSEVSRVILSGLEEWPGKAGKRVIVREADVVDCTFDKSDFRNTSFQHCRFKNCTFKSTPMQESEFVNTQFVNCRFVGVNAQSSQARRLCFLQCDIRGLGLTNLGYVDVALIKSSVAGLAVSNSAQGTAKRLVFIACDTEENISVRSSHLESLIIDGHLAGCIEIRGRRVTFGMTMPQWGLYLVRYGLGHLSNLFEPARSATLSGAMDSTFNRWQGSVTLRDLQGKKLDLGSKPHRSSAEHIRIENADIPIGIAGSQIDALAIDNVSRSIRVEHGSINTLEIGTSVKEAEFYGMHIDELCIRNTDAALARPIKFGTCKIGSDENPADVNGTNLQHTAFRSCTFGTGANFSKTLLTNADFTGSNIVAANMKEADISGAVFQHATLTDTNLENVRVDSETVFGDARVNGVTIHRFTLVSMRDYGGLSVGQRIEMKIQDDAAKVRQLFSGWLRVLHLIGLTLFLAPYATLAAFLFARAILMEGSHGDTVTVWQALMNYIATGGEQWENGGSKDPAAIALVGTLVLYNSARLGMFARCIQLDAKEATTGLPPIWHMNRFWNGLYMAMWWGAFVSAGAGLWHAMIFLGTDIPVTPIREVMTW